MVGQKCIGAFTTHLVTRSSPVMHFETLLGIYDLASGEAETFCATVSFPPQLNSEITITNVYLPSISILQTTYSKCAKFLKYFSTNAGKITCQEAHESTRLPAFRRCCEVVSGLPPPSSQKISRVNPLLLRRFRDRGRTRQKPHRLGRQTNADPPARFERGLPAEAWTRILAQCRRWNTSVPFRSKIHCVSA